MKKLLLGLSIAVLSVATINAQPVVQDATLRTDRDGYLADTLLPYLQGGQPPYTFELIGKPLEGRFSDSPYYSDTIKNVRTFSLQQNGNFLFQAGGSVSEPLLPSTHTFRYTVTDDAGQTSEPATITINVGDIVEKG